MAGALGFGEDAVSQPVWRPQAPEARIPMNIYRQEINSKFGQSFQNSQELHRWSVENPQQFWIHLYEYVGIIPPLPPSTTKAYDESKPISSVPPFFENVRLNYAENVLSNRELDSIALIGLREGQSLDGDKWTWRDLIENVRKTASALKRSGVKEGDRVAALISTSIWSIVLFLAAASQGIVFTSIAPDLGVEGCISRLQQVTPAFLFADSDVTYKGRQASNIPKVHRIINALSHQPQTFIIPLATTDFSSLPSLDTFLSRSSSLDRLIFVRLPFSHPLYILYSSGTTGPPKCLVHQHGVIIQLKKIAILHNSLTSNDMIFQYSSTSWVLWNVMNGHLSVGATLITYDGSPLWPDPQAMLKILEKYRVTYWGTSPRYLLELEATKCIPRQEFDLSSLRMVTSTGASLAVDQFHWFYHAFPSHVHLSSIAGGTDIVTSWIASDPAGPVYAGEMQLPGLGMDVDVADPETGKSVKHTGQPGELICWKPFPSMPIYLWGDTDNKKYKSSYFDRFDFPCWAQHDWIVFNPKTGGCAINGRSDGVLNPSGIRFGSAEIYAIVEGPAFNTEIWSTLCVGRRRLTDADEAVFLFVLMRPGHIFTDDLLLRLRDAIRKGLSGRHVPRFILPVAEIPVTVNGKKVETLVKGIISQGRVGKVSSTVGNPGCLEGYLKYYLLEEKVARL